MENRQDGETGLESLHVIETGSSPRAETAVLRELLHGGPPLLSNLAELSACKHRLQALRCEYVSARARAEELEMELKDSHFLIRQLENNVRYLQSTLDQMRASRTWKVVETCSRLFARLFRRG